MKKLIALTKKVSATAKSFLQTLRIGLRCARINVKIAFRIMNAWLKKFKEKVVNKIKKSIFWMCIIPIYVVLIFISMILSFYPTTLFGEEWNWGLEMFLFVTVYTVISFRKINETELGARLLIGKPVDNVSSGFVFVPRYFFSLITETRLNVQDELPCESKDIYREPKEGSDGTIPKGKFPPIRIPFGLPKSGDGIPDDDPYNMRMVVEVVPVVTWKIVDFIQFRTTLGNIKEARRQMEDTAIEMMTEAFAKITPANALQNLSTHSGNLKEAIETRIKGEKWGIELITAKIKPFDFSRSLNTAILKIPVAIVTAKSKIIEAKGYKEIKDLEGKGDGAKEEHTIKGRTAGLKNMASDLDVSGSTVLGAETARGVTSNPGQKTIIAGSGGFADLAVVGNILGDALMNKERKGVQNEI